MNKVFILCLFLICGAINLQAQIPVPELNSGLPGPLKSPSMASFGIQGNIPVGSFTGITDFSLPLYQVNYKELSVPISISYVNSSGNKVDAMPGQLGLGWKLSAGGAITRTSKELSGAEVMSALGTPLEINENPTGRSDWASTTLLNDYLQRDYYIYSDSIKYDGFSYNFLGHSGTIYFDHTGKARIKSTTGEDYKIELKFVNNKVITFPTEDQLPNTVAPVPFAHKDLLYSFILTDNNGIKYTFGGTNESIEFVRSGLEVGVTVGSHNSFGVIASNWQLTRIESPAGYKIELEYRRGKIVISKSNVSSTKISFRGYASLYPLSPAKSYGEEINLVNAYSNTLTNPVYLHKIITPQQKVEFSGSSANGQLAYPLNSTSDVFIGNKTSFAAYPDIRSAVDTDVPHFYEKLDNIKVFDLENLRYRTFSFNYNYNSTTRLKLDSINIYGGLSSIQTYSFKYNTLSLPAYLSSKTDHLGYYNNKTDTEAMADVSHDFDLYYLSREPDFNYGQAEILTKVIFPTRGYSTFQYEQNQYGSVAKTWPFVVAVNAGNTALNACGLRIKEVKTYNHDDVLADRKTYFYVGNYANGGTYSSGVLSHIPVYYRDLHTNNLTPPAQYASNTTNFNFEARVRLWSSQSINGLMAGQGNPITYTEVCEKGIDNSFKIYTYKNYDNGYPDKVPLAYVSDHSAIKEFWKDDPGSSMDLERGQILQEEIFDNNGVRKQKIVYGYNDDPLRFNEFVRVVRKRPNDFYSPKAFIPSIRFTASQNFTYYPYLKEKEKTDFLDNGNIIESTAYTYNENKLIKTETATNSAGKINRVEYSYPKDMVSVGQTVPYPAMVDSNLNAKVVRKKYFVDGVEHLMVTTAYTKWSLNKTMYLPSLISQKQVGFPEETMTTFLKYDALGNPFVFKERSGSEKVVIWGYKGEYPVFTLDNANYFSNQLIIDSYSSNSWVYDNPTDTELSDAEVFLKNNLPGVYLSKSAYFPLAGLKVSKDVKGMNTYYEYDDFLRLKYAKDHKGYILKQYCYTFKGNAEDCNGPVFPGPSFINAPPPGNQFFAAYFTSIEAIKNQYRGDFSIPIFPPPTPPDLPPPHEPAVMDPIYSNATGFDVPVGDTPYLYYKDSSRQILIPNGYYSLLETDTNNSGYKYYYVQNGLFQNSGWSSY